MTHIAEKPTISNEDKLDFFDEIFCKIQCKNNTNPEYLIEFIDFIDLYTTIIPDEDSEYINDHPFYYNDIKNLTILEEFYEMTDIYNIQYFTYIDPHNHNYINEFNHYLYYDFNQCPKKIFTKTFINEFKVYIYDTLNLFNNLK